MDDTGYEEFFYDNGGVCLIEWADLILGLLPEEYIVVEIERVSDDERKIVVRASRQKPEQALSV